MAASPYPFLRLVDQAFTHQSPLARLSSHLMSIHASRINLWLSDDLTPNNTPCGLPLLPSKLPF